MQFSNTCKDLVKKWEGLYLKAYLCPTGHPTIGWGTTRYVQHTMIKRGGKDYKTAQGEKVQLGDTITIEEAERNLHAELNEFAWQIKKYLKVELTQGQFDAIVSLTYNIGLGNKDLGVDGFTTSTCLRKLNMRDYQGAADAILLWNKGTINGEKVVIQGLVNRRKEERELFLSGTIDEINNYETIKRGDRGQAVRVLQESLITLKYFPANEVVDGIFGQNTESKVRLFQRNNELTIDGIVGPETWGKLFELLESDQSDDKPDQPEDPWAGLKGNYIVVKRTHVKKPNGLELLSAVFYENGVKYGSLPMYSGQAYAQEFKKGRETYSGSMEPPAETKKGYYVHDIRWAASPDDYTKLISSGLGSFFVWLEPHDKNDTRRREIGFHVDANKYYAPGSAGCLVVENNTQGKKLVQLLRKANPRQLYVDWELDYVQKKLV